MNTRKNFLNLEVAEHWNRLPKEEVDTPSPYTFKVRKDRTLSNLM